MNITQRQGVPIGSARSRAFASTLRSEMVTHDGKDFAEVVGYASITERGYELWDQFGPYTETIAARAFDQTLANNPEVHFLVNHKGLAMARTHANTLDLSVDEQGLKVRALLNPKRSDVNDLLAAIDDGSLAEMSFAFEIKRGQWSPDFTEYRIEEVDLNRGDVSAVNYGANPHTSIAARAAQQVFEAIDVLDRPALEAAHARLAAKLGPSPVSRVGLLRAQLELDD